VVLTGVGGGGGGGGDTAATYSPAEKHAHFTV